MRLTQNAIGRSPAIPKRMSNCSKGSIDKKIYDFKVLSKNFDGKILTSEIPENQVIDLKRQI